MSARDRDRSAREGSHRAVLAALGANVAVAIAKFVGFVVTRSASLLAESLHSVADSANEALLLFGAARARREPSTEHPFGFGRERYFWSFVVAIVLFTAGGLFALIEGEEKLRRPEHVGSVPWAVGILVAAMVFESLSLRTAVRRARPLKGDRSWLRFVRESKQAEITVVLLEDSAALLGLLFGLAGVGLAAITANGRFDAIGSLAIGALLVVIAWLLAGEMKSFLIGESAAAVDLASIRSVIESNPRVDSLVAMRTEQLGPEELLLGAQVELRFEDLTAPAVPATLTELEAADPPPGAQCSGRVPHAGRLRGGTTGDGDTLTMSAAAQRPSRAQSCQRV